VLGNLLHSFLSLSLPSLPPPLCHTHTHRQAHSNIIFFLFHTNTHSLTLSLSLILSLSLSHSLSLSLSLLLKMYHVSFFCCCCCPAKRYVKLRRWPSLRLQWHSMQIFRQRRNLFWNLFLSLIMIILFNKLRLKLT